VAEMLDIYDENMTWLGAKERAAVHRDGDWHRVFQCWVIYRDDAGRDFVVMQRRSPIKETFPNKLDVSAAGHYAAGETAREGLRELSEELGIAPRFDDLIPLGVRVSVARCGGLIDREFADVFFLVDGRPLSAYSYRCDEVAGLAALETTGALALLEHGTPLVAQAVGHGAAAQITVTRDDLIPTVDNYLYKIVLLAQRCLDGERRLAI